MKLFSTELTELAHLAIDAATSAGEMIARSRPKQIQHKSSGGSLASQVVTEVDRRSEAIILETLTPTLQRFELGLLTEEQPDDGGRFRADYFWCIDPIDGTLPFIEGTPGYAVSIALVRRDGTPTIGVVFDPVGKTVVHAIADAGAFRNGQPWEQPSSNGTVRATQVYKAGNVVDFARSPQKREKQDFWRSPLQRAHMHCEKLSFPGGTALSLFTDRSFLSSEGRDQITAGLEQIARDMGLAGLHVNATAGAVMNACKVLANPLACYVKLPKQNGGGSLWDYAATACIFSEAGAVATDINGQPFDLNRADSTLMCHRGILFATNEMLAQRIRSLFR